MIAETSREYHKIGSIYCSALKENIIFNNYGWKHLRFDGHGHKRNEQDLRRRLHLFKHAVEVLKNCKTAGEKEQATIHLKKNPRDVIYIEIGHECKTKLGNKNIVVILRKFEKGPYHYYSIR